jgi:hypothetical protein
VTFGRYAVLEAAEQAVMKREYSTHHIHYDPISGYIHKFRLDGSQQTPAPDEASADEHAASLPLFVAGAIAIGLMLVIGVLTL